MDSSNIEELKKRFIRIYVEDIECRPGAADLLGWLLKTDFFEAPASTKYHGAYEGGLLKHSLNVYYRLREKLANEGAIDRFEDSTIATVALLHDVCKADFYEKNIITRREDDGSEEEIPIWGYKSKGYPGHGERSVYLISRYMELSEEEAVAIDRHMGPYDRRGHKELSRIWKEYPLAYYLHMADMEATWQDEIFAQLGYKEVEE